MTSVDENRLRGNHAEALVSAWLSRRCLVRPVANGTDIGIDLYCEAVTEGRPDVHFWVQVKAIPTSAVKQGEAGFSFKTRHLEYWMRQPIPVYAFLVPLGDWPPEPPQAIYGVRITEHLVREGLPSKKTCFLSTGNCFEATSVDDDLEQFISEVVPWDTAASWLQRGVVSRLSDPATPSLTDQFVRDIGLKHLPKVLLTLSDGVAHGLLESLRAEKAEPSWEPIRRRFQELAAVLEADLHPLGMSALAWALHHDGDLEAAKDCVSRASARIASDPAVSAEEKEDLAAQLQGLLAELESTPA